MKKTYQPIKSEVRRSWHLIDAKSESLGRFSTKIATYLMGKNKPSYSPHMDNGDYVVVVNAKEVVVTGRKKDQKMYRSHSMFPGGFKEISFSAMIERHPERVVEYAVWGMLPSNRLRAKRMKRLFIYPDSKHPYEKKFVAK